ncbi:MULTISPECIES: signal peptidase I [Streptococcus]|uniref:Signal peptidase I n=1 Tax=Streptococcus caledonicus TaxID=2614158 RepID=A0ABW0U9B7_9STRE|nr:signal peptidase I [Streptococcus sp. S784/96/1]
MKHFIKEWGLFILLMATILLSYLFVWFTVKVDGHSMDPTLADGENLFVVKISQIDRFDIVVADEVDESGESKKIVKRVIGIPGDTITYDNDTLYINGKETDEAYLKEYRNLFAKDKLQSTYSYNKFFQQLAEQSPAFTSDRTGSSSFTVQVPEGHYYLLGDDRIVSKDSRAVGTFDKEAIVGEIKFRYWPLNKIGTID